MVPFDYATFITDPELFGHGAFIGTHIFVADDLHAGYRFSGLGLTLQPTWNDAQLRDFVADWLVAFHHAYFPIAGHFKGALSEVTLQ